MFIYKEVSHFVQIFHFVVAFTFFPSCDANKLEAHLILFGGEFAIWIWWQIKSHFSFFDGTSLAS